MPLPLPLPLRGHPKLHAEDVEAWRLDSDEEVARSMWLPKKDKRPRQEMTPQDKQQGNSPLKAPSFPAAVYFSAQSRGNHHATFCRGADAPDSGCLCQPRDAAIASAAAPPPMSSGDRNVDDRDGVMLVLTWLALLCVCVCGCCLLLRVDVVRRRRLRVPCLHACPPALSPASQNSMCCCRLVCAH